MDERTLKLDIPLLIPGLNNDRDACLDRLNQALLSRKGIQLAHIEHADDQPLLCLHYDPAMVSIEDLRRIAIRAGAQIANRYHHEVIAIEGMDCSDCVTVLEHSLKRLEGTLDVKVSYTSQKVYVEYDATKINRATIEHRINQLGYRVEPVGIRRWFEENRAILFSLTSGLLILIGWVEGVSLVCPLPSAWDCTWLPIFWVGGTSPIMRCFHCESVNLTLTCLWSSLRLERQSLEILPKAHCCCSCSAWGMLWKNAPWIAPETQSAPWPI